MIIVYQTRLASHTHHSSQLSHGSGVRESGLDGQSDCTGENLVVMGISILCVEAHFLAIILGIVSVQGVS
jgi:hypothetical protein